MASPADLAREIDRLKRANAALLVDRDRKVREAMRRADDCTEHGKEITYLNQQAHHFSTLADQHDQARMVLVDAAWILRGQFKAAAARAQHGDAPPAAELFGAAARGLDKALDAHTRALNRKPRPAPAPPPAGDAAAEQMDLLSEVS